MVSLSPDSYKGKEIEIEGQLTSWPSIFCSPNTSFCCEEFLISICKILKRKTDIDMHTPCNKRFMSDNSIARYWIDRLKSKNLELHYMSP